MHAYIAIATSTYGAEFYAMKLATEEAIMIRYMLRSLGIPVSSPCHMYGDSSSIIQNVSKQESPLKKKNLALCFHFVRENVATKTIRPIKLGSKDNFADLLTKPLVRGDFMILCHMSMVYYGIVRYMNRVKRNNL
jgi:hypothetical protein